MPAYPYNPNFMGRGNDPDQDQVALFIDWDNLVISNYADRGSNRPNIEVIVQKAQQYGTVVIARAYAEWSIMVDRLEVYKAGVEPIYAPVFHASGDLSGQTGKGKSLADPVMVTDCIDFLHLLPQVGTYVLVTGDKDMMPVVRLAKLRGRRVVVIGPDYVANVLQQVSDEFVPYRALLPMAQPADPYAAGYYQQGSYYQPQVQQGYYPPQIGQSGQSQSADSRSRTGRRLSSGRRTPAPQPYKDVQSPQPGQPQSYPNYYAPAQSSAQAPWQGYPAQPNMGAAYGGYPSQPPAGPQPQPAYPGYAPEMQNQPAAVYPQTPAVPAAAPVPSYQPPPAQPSGGVSQPSVPAASAPAATNTGASPASQPSAASRAGSTSNFEEVKDAIRSIMNSRTGNGRGQTRARDLKEELLRRIPNFNERRYGFSKFKALLNAVEQAGILQLDQSGHILWVSLPGTPKAAERPGFDDTSLEATSAVPEDELEDEEDEEEEETEVSALEELDRTMETTSEPEFAAVPSFVMMGETGGDDNDLETAVEAPDQEGMHSKKSFEERYTPTPAAEERVTTLVDAPIGAHRERDRERKDQAQISDRQQPHNATKIPGLGARPALLEQPYYEDVIVLIEGLRHRNRWLGYELLLSSVRDYLTKHMPESEAKSQAGVILSKLLNEGVLKMAMEVHSRGARKMRVQVAHLIEEQAAVRFALAAKAAADQENSASASYQNPATDAPLEGREETAQPENQLSSPDAQTFEAAAEIVAQKGEVVLVADEGGVPVLQTREEGGGQPDQSNQEPQQEHFQQEGAADNSVQPLNSDTERGVHDQHSGSGSEASPVTQIEGQSSQSSQGHFHSSEVGQESGEPGQDTSFRPGENSHQDQGDVPQADAAAEAGQLGQEPVSVENGRDPVQEVTLEGVSDGPQSSQSEDHSWQVADQPEEHRQFSSYDEQPSSFEYQTQELPNETRPTGYSHHEASGSDEAFASGNHPSEETSSHSIEGGQPGVSDIASSITGQAVTTEVIETSETAGSTGEDVMGQPSSAPEGEQPAPAGGYINSGEMDDHHAARAENPEAEGEDNSETEGAELSAEAVPLPRRRRRVNPQTHS